MYKDKDELLQEILAGEDTLLEFKEVVFKGNQIRFASEEGKAPKVIAGVFVSMANTEGGVVLFGVNKYNEVVGVDEGKKDILEQFVVNCALNNCEPKGSIEPILDWRYLPCEEGVDCLILQITIPKAQFYVHSTADGRFLKRIGSHRVPIPGEQLGRLLAAKNLLIPFEERPCSTTEMSDFNRELFESYYERRFGSSPTTSGLSIERLLSNLKLAVELDGGSWRLSNLGVMLFSDSPQDWLPGAYIEIAVYDHDVADGNTIDAKRMQGPVTKQITDALGYFQTSPYMATKSRKNGEGRQDSPQYSMLALQEAIVNAVVHRDYELTGSQTIVTIFPDKIEIKNPGGLHNTLKPEDLYSGCQPMRRNQHLAGFLRDFPSPLTGSSLMEARVEGFLNMIRESEAISGVKPEIELIGQAVKLTIYAGENSDTEV